MVIMICSYIIHSRKRYLLLALLIFSHSLVLLLGCWLWAAGYRLEPAQNVLSLFWRDAVEVNPSTTDQSHNWLCAKKKIEQRNSSGDKSLGTVVILTPIFNSANHLHRYFKNLCSFSFPHHQMSIVLGEDSSNDNTLKVAKAFARQLQGYFRRVEVVELSAVTSHKPWDKPHDKALQLRRREHLAKSRNGLLFAGLRTEKWVLWLDVDVTEMPTDIIQQLMKENKDIIVPACMYHRPVTGYSSIYDRNSWRETNESIKFLKNKPAGFLMLEGYKTSTREFIHLLGRDGKVVKLDGVGACVLLIQADCHRKGLIFPPFIYKHHIESEGLAMMAKDMGFGVYGIPKLFVFHV